MKTLITRYLNEIVGRTIMALMTGALIGGQADATSKEVVAEQGRAVIEIRVTLAD
jgi:hypothetical protein